MQRGARMKTEKEITQQLMVLLEEWRITNQSGKYRVSASIKWLCWVLDKNYDYFAIRYMKEVRE